MRRLALSLVAALVVALAAGLLPVATATAYADTYYADYVPTPQDNADALAAKKVTFNGYDWYVIEDKSSAADEGTVTLLAADLVATGQRFANSSNAYGTSDVKAYLDGLTAEGDSFAGVADAIVATDLTDVGVTGARLWLPNKSEVDPLPIITVRDVDVRWWLRSPVCDDGPANVTEAGQVDMFGENVGNAHGVRPALKLDLTKVVFNETAKEFTPLVAVTGVTLSPAAVTLKVGEVQKLTATVEPVDAANRKVKWYKGGAPVGLYYDEDCTRAVSEGEAVNALEVYAKAEYFDHDVSVYCYSDMDQSIRGRCRVKVEKAEPEPVITAAVAKVARPSAVGAAASRSFRVTWKAAKGAKTYQVQWRAAGGKWQGAVTAKGTSYVVRGLKTGTAYEFRVRGVNGDVRGAWSSPARRWLKAASKVRAAAGKQPGSIRVTWAKDARANAGFKVYVYAKRGGRAVKTVEVAKDKTSVTIKGLKANKTYYVRMRPMRRASGNTFSGLICGYRAAKAAK